MRPGLRGLYAFVPAKNVQYRPVSQVMSEPVPQSLPAYGDPCLIQGLGRRRRKNLLTIPSSTALRLRSSVVCWPLTRSIEINSTTVMITIKTITNMASFGVSQLGGSGDQCLGLRDQMGCRFVLRNHGVYSCPRR